MKTQYTIFLGLLPLAWCTDFSKVPSCSKSCVTDYIKSTGCDSTDWTCICNADYTLQSALASCLYSSCSTSDILTFETISEEVCYGALVSSIMSSATADVFGLSTALPTAVATVTEGGSTFTVTGTATAGISETSAAASSSGNSSSGGLSPGAIAGIVVGSVVGIAALVGLAFFFGRRKGKQGQPQAASAEAPQMQPAPFAGAPTLAPAPAPAPAPASVNTLTPPPGYFTPSPISTTGVVPVQVMGESKFIEMDGTAGEIRYEMPHSAQTRPELSPQTAPNRHELGVEHPTTVYELGGSR